MENITLSHLHAEPKKITKDEIYRDKKQNIGYQGWGMGSVREKEMGRGGLEKTKYQMWDEEVG